MKLGNYPKSFGRRLGLLVAIASLFFVGDRCFAWLCDQATKTSQARLPKAYTGRMNCDVVILGNSRAIKSFDLPQLEQKLSVTVANLGVNGMRPALLNAVALDFLAANAKPKFCFIEVSYLKNDWDDALAAEFIPYASYGKHTNELLWERLPKHMIADQIFHLRRFGGQQFFRSLTFLKKSDQEEASKRSMTAAAEAALDSSPEAVYASSKETLAAFAALVATLEQSDVKVTLIFAPIQETFRNKIAGLPEWIQQVAAATNHSVRDYSAGLSDRKFFADSVHLNQDGQTMFTEMLLKDSGL